MLTEIARRCGFVGISHFGRSLATRFGMTRSATRAKAAPSTPLAGC
jgi:transcriptional regulator GlxA family with amidase domain